MPPPTTWIHVVGSADGWRVQRETGKVLARFDEDEQAAAVDFARSVCRVEGGDFIVRGEQGAGGTRASS